MREERSVRITRVICLLSSRQLERRKKTYRLHGITLLEPLHLVSAHLHPVLPGAALHAVHPLLLLQRAVLQRRPADVVLALLVPVQHVHQLLVVRLALGLDLGVGPVRLPQVRVPSILEEALLGHFWS